MAVIVKVDAENLREAGYVHSESWKASHASFCTPEFVEKHTPAAQTQYLRREMEAGKRIYMLVEEQPAGIVSIFDGLIENLYVLPERQNRGYGTELLKFALTQCGDGATLWILSNNVGAYRLYSRWGFAETGRTKPLNGGLYELEMRRNIR